MMMMSRKKGNKKQAQGESLFPEGTNSARFPDFIFPRNFSFYSDSWDSLKVIFRLLQFEDAPSKRFRFGKKHTTSLISAFRLKENNTFITRSEMWLSDGSFIFKLLSAKSHYSF